MKYQKSIICNSFFLVLITFGLFALAHASEAATRYVYPNCSGKPTPCYTTIQAAANVVNAGDTVMVGDGTYSPTSTYMVDMTRGGTSDNWITFKSENKWGAKIKGTSASTDPHRYAINFMSTANYIRIEDFEITGMPHGLWSNEGAHHLVFKGNHLHDIGYYCPGGSNYDNNGGSGGFMGGGTNNYTFDSNLIHDNGRPANCGTYTQSHNFTHDHGLYLAGSNVTVINNIFYNHTAGWDIQMSGGSASNSNWQIINNTFASYNPQNKGQILMWKQGGYGPSNVTIQNNISYNANGAFIQHNYYTGTTGNVYRYNLIESGDDLVFSYPSAPSYTAANTLSGNALFVNASAYDFHLQAGSPAINAGLNANKPTYDYAGVVRGNPPEIGAYEYVGSDTSPPAAPSGLSVN